MWLSAREMKNRICTIAFFRFAAKHKNVTRKDLQISKNYMICFLKKLKQQQQQHQQENNVPENIRILKY